MSFAVGAALLTVTLATGGTGWERPALPQPVIEAGLKKARCTVPPLQAKILGTEMLSSHLRIVEVACWQTATNAGSILFAVPLARPQDARLVMIDRWQDGKVRHGYSVSSPGFDAKTRTISSTHKARGAGDCGTIQEMKWTGWHFRLLNAWSKVNCDGEPFEWDSRDKWQVFTRRPPQADPETSVSGRDGAQSSRE